MTTSKQDTPLQRALDAYSLAVQQYSQVVHQLPASMRPAPFDRFKHRGNIFAIRRRTEEVTKATTRLQRAAHGRQLPASKTAATEPVKQTSQHTSNAKTTAAEPVKETSQETSDANPVAGNSGSAHAVVDCTVDGLKPTGNRVGDPGSAQEHPTVVVQAPDTSRTPDPEMAEETGASPTRDRAQLFTYHEVELLIRIAASSPDAAGICARRIGQMKSYAAGPADIREVLETVIRWVESGGSANDRQGGGNKGQGA
ncbi:hypothetical protein FN846DRAFT_991411 [Sphaerosporella brunnea]|uniref:Uncharacterized protein n=1 Tax=Sphaerosporella brunnea TaxID=1250544 RepID=A0A5J5EN64_9PEZI|nr:hypothetical protein FN846DRAFT_991411 [Sphaerosporella brunnea]